MAKKKSGPKKRKKPAPRSKKRAGAPRKAKGRAKAPAGARTPTRAAALLTAALTTIEQPSGNVPASNVNMVVSVTGVLAESVAQVKGGIFTFADVPSNEATIPPGATTLTLDPGDGKYKGGPFPVIGTGDRAALAWAFINTERIRRDFTVT
jgi:hypothetical protein